MRKGMDQVEATRSVLLRIAAYSPEFDAVQRQQGHLANLALPLTLGVVARKHKRRLARERHPERAQGRVELGCEFLRSGAREGCLVIVRP